MESKPKVVDVKDKHCIGCVKHQSDVMVTMLTPEGEFCDFFLTTEQADYLYMKLGRVILNNKEIEIDNG